jgi:hypothetical protein
MRIYGLASPLKGMSKRKKARIEAHIERQKLGWAWNPDGAGNKPKPANRTQRKQARGKR